MTQNTVLLCTKREIILLSVIERKFSLCTASFVVNRQQHVSAIKAIF